MWRRLDPERSITIVSGLPRSGTSLMMQMLAAAGLDLASDGCRGPDTDNPHGYHELEAVKRLPDDAAFLAGTVGRALKVVAPLLHHLPSRYEYRVLFMERATGEVLASQRVMLERTGAASAGGDDAEIGPLLERAQARALAWLDAQPNVVVCRVSHRDTVAHPAGVATRVLDFLDRTGAFAGRETPSAARLAEVVDPELARAGAVGG